MFNTKEVWGTIHKVVNHTDSLDKIKEVVEVLDDLQLFDYYIHVIQRNINKKMTEDEIIYTLSLVQEMLIGLVSELEVG